MMKKFIAISAVMLLVCSTVFAVDFAPSVLTLSAPDAVNYGFDGAMLSIPVQVSGTPASTILCVFTKDMAAAMPMTQNGHLGWHTVNKIDTCIYAAAPVLLSVGSNTVKWDGKDQDGNAVESGEYTYYLFGYDSVNTKYSACDSLNHNSWNIGNIVDYDPLTGAPLEKPIVYVHSITAPPEGTLGRSKWILGNDPADGTLVETCYYSTALSAIRSIVAPSPYEANKFWISLGDAENKTVNVTQYQWVPNGEAVLQTDWGTDGYYNYSMPNNDGWDLSVNDINYVGNDMLIATRGSHYGGQTEAEVIILDATDGTETTRIDLSDFWVSLEDGEAGGQSSSGPTRTDVNPNGDIFLDAHSSCMNLVINLSKGEDREDWLLWANDNGDYTGDHNFEEDSEKPWVCHDYNVGPYKYSFHNDGNDFTAFPSFDLGAVSFGLYAPDGTGLSYHAYAAETAGGKLGTDFISTGSAYDGIYTDNASVNGAWDGPTGIWFVGQDSIMGTITTGVSVDDGPAAFDVAQNAPNPFNPTTAISFSIAEAGNVSVDVFSITGQKVGTIANEFMSAGSHSVTWDASGQSAGVYFYTVKSGDFSKTMKMTLLK